MANETRLGSLVVIGGYREKSVRAHTLRLLGELYSIGGIVAARAGDDWDALIYLLDHVFQRFAVFLVVQDRGFAGRCAGDDGVGAVANLEFDQLPKFFIIDGAVLVHGRDQRHACLLYTSASSLPGMT